MSSISQNIITIKKQLPAHVRLVAVSKFNPQESIQEAYDCGQRVFGESHAQELVPKAEHLPKDIQWHFIGHLQTNKVKYIVPYVSLIHGVDTFKLLSEIDRQAAKISRQIVCLLQFHIAQEQTKYGFSLAECEQMLQSQSYKQLQNIRLAGVMGMATDTEDINQVRYEFRSLKEKFDYLKTHYFSNQDDFCEISMGMTHDYSIAIEEGSTLVRIGSGIFGERMYQ